VLRVLFVVLALFGGAGLLLYGVAWLVVPEEGEDQGKVHTGETVRNAVLIGALAVAVLLAFNVDSHDGHFFPWPLLLIGVVVAAFLLGRDNRRNDRSNDRPGLTYAPPPAGGVEPTVTLEKPPAWYPPVAPPPPPAPRRTGPLLFWPALALVALALGALGLYDATGGAVSSAAYPALALAVIGLVLVVGAFVGRPGGLILLGVLAAVSLLFTAVVDPAYSGPRDLSVTPTSRAALDDTYHVPAGRIVLDLSDMDPAALDGRSLDLSVGAGEVVVTVPRSVQVAYDATVDFGGHIDIDGHSDDGWSPALSGTAGPARPASYLTLQLSADFGQLQVVRS
jgi:MFS family permease